MLYFIKEVSVCYIGRNEMWDDLFYKRSFCLLVLFLTYDLLVPLSI